MSIQYHIRSCLVFALILVSVCCSLGGCFSYRQASGQANAPTPMAMDAWPSFETETIEHLAQTPKVIVRSTIDADRMPNPWAKGGQRSIEVMENFHTDDLLIARVDEHGIVRVWKDRRRWDLNPIPSATGYKPSSFHQNASYLTGPESSWALEVQRIRTEVGGEEPRAYFSIYGFESTGETERWQLRHGIRMAAPEIIREDPAGLIVHITGIMETDYEHALTYRLRAHGFAAAYIESDISLDGPNEHAMRVQYSERTRRIEELTEQGNIDPKTTKDGQLVMPSKEEKKAYVVSMKKLYKQVREEFPSPEDGFQIHPDTDIEELGRIVAAAVDKKVAEHAYAAEAIVRASDELHPALVNKPIIVMGYSAGSLVSPGVVARLKLVYPDRPIRLVLIGSGGDMITVATNSSFGSGMLSFAPKDGPEPTAEQLEQLRLAYLRSTRLDPLVVAPSISDIPALHLYASHDKAVPTRAALMLNSAHGHVDTLKHYGNHGTLFFFASGQAGKIRSWLRAHGVESN